MARQQTGRAGITVVLPACGPVTGPLRATGLWPLVSLASFERVTGPKTDDWLVHTVGSLAAARALWTGARAERPVGAIVLLAAASAASFAIVDLT